MPIQGNFGGTKSNDHSPARHVAVSPSVSARRPNPPTGTDPAFSHPGSDHDFRSRAAYLLQVNGFPAGSRELTATGAADVRIEAEDGPGDVPSFALVSVVGCLERGDGGDWMLTRAAPAVRTADPSESSPEALGALADRPPGTRTFELMAVYPDPAAHAGHRMEAKGFLIRSPDGDRVNVSTLGMVADACDP